MKTDGNSPIVPVHHNDGSLMCDNEDKHWQEHARPYLGLTKREHFAAMAMQGLVASTSSIGSIGAPYSIADRSVEIADALIASLNKEDESTASAANQPQGNGK